MSLFSRPFVGADPTTSFTPLFRLLDDFDTYNRDTGDNSHQHRRHAAKSFNPRFDVTEQADQYELHGEVPGIDQKDIGIEFTDAQTLTIRGRTERSYTSSTAPGGQVEGSRAKAQISEKGEHNGHNATVEDEEISASHEANTTVVARQPQQEQPQTKYWVSERNVGEFHRSFTFPARVDQDAVSASMKNGVISIVVPKAKKHEGRKITIS